MHWCMPPPKPRYAYGVLCSSRGAAKRSGSNRSGSLNTSGRRIATDGAVMTISPFGTVHFLPSFDSIGTSFIALRISMMSGGCMRRASFMQLCMSSSFCTCSNVRVSPPTTSSTSLITRCMISGLEQHSSAVQVEVTLLVCCPAKSRAMSRPVIWSSVFFFPLLYSISMNTCKMSVLFFVFSGLALRSLITLPKSFTISLRALSRVLCAAIGAFGKKKEKGVMPWSRSW
mmetsp:Transcript_36309/g.83994  ORF Transcript_36309/g.83994 Transcript_36309/m.83994 type:complete len:229 (-) Transcript_36309:636-1322(-)